MNNNKINNEEVEWEGTWCGLIWLRIRTGRGVVVDTMTSLGVL